VNNASLPIYYAADKGLFTKYGLTANVSTLANDQLGMQGLLAKDFDIIFVGAGSAAAAIAAGSNIKVIDSPSPHIDDWFLAKDDIKDLKGMEGRTLGVSALGGFSHVVAITLLKKHGVDTDKLKVVAAGSDAPRGKALIAGTIDGGVMNALVTTETIRTGGSKVHILADAGAELSSQFFANVVAARSDSVQGSPKVLQAAVEALTEGARALQSSKDTYVTFAKTQQGIPPESVDGAYDLLSKMNIVYYGVDGGLSKSDFDSTIDTLVQTSQLKSKVTWEQAVDTQFVDQMIKNLGQFKKS